MSEPAAGLEISGLRKRVGGFTLEADFRVGHGSRAALLGRSGSGKTTLLRLLAGLESLAPDGAGRIVLDGEELTGLAPEARRIGVVFQEQALFPALDVLENAGFGLRVRGVPRAEREAQVLPWLTRVGLGDRAREPVTRLSGGERQRVAFVRALVWKPRLILLDEPFSALDASLRQGLRRELVELHALWPVPLILVTHDEADVEALATLRIPLAESADGAVRAFRAGSS